MRSSTLWLASAVLATLVVQERAAAQPPGRRGGPGGGLERVLDDLKLSTSQKDKAEAAVQTYQDNGRRLTELVGADLMLKMKEILSEDEYKKVKAAVDTFRSNRGPGPGGQRGGFGGRAVSADDMVERIMSFDKNKDGKVTKDELPERMQYLIEKGDTNKDGVLDKEEIKKLAADLARDGTGRNGGRGGQGGPGNRVADVGGFPPRVIERAVDDLKLSDKKKESAAAAVKASQDNIRKLTELARADLLVKLDGVLGAEDFSKFKAALDRQPSFGERPPFGRGRP